MKSFIIVCLGVALAASVYGASNDQCSYSVYRNCELAGPGNAKSNILLNHINGIKLNKEKRNNAFAAKLYGAGSGGGSGDGDDGEDDNGDVYASALCPCECSRCPKPMKAKDSEEDDNECLCLCGTCGKTNNNKNKLPAVVPLDCGLKCEVISEIPTGGNGGGSYGGGSYGGGTSSKGSSSYERH